MIQSEKAREKQRLWKKKKYASDEAYREDRKIKSRLYYQNNKEKVKTCNDKWQAKNMLKVRKYKTKWTNKTPGYNMFHNAKRRARNLGLPFSIHYTEIVIPEFCPILNIKLEKEPHDLRPSLDRVNPSLGYTKENTRVISVRANRYKQDATAAEHRRIADYIDGLI